MKISPAWSSYLIGVVCGVVVIGGYQIVTNQLASNKTAQPAARTEQLQDGGNQNRRRNPGSETGSFDRSAILERQAEILGMTAIELQSELDAGKVFRDLAKEKGIDVSEFSGNSRGGQNVGEEASATPSDSLEVSTSPIIDASESPAVLESPKGQ